MRRNDLPIGVYVLSRHAKQTYSKECYDVRVNAGMAVVCDVLRRAGFTNIAYCSAASVHRFRAVMFSVTADCDWWAFLEERSRWPTGDYKVIVGGAGVLNPRPFLGLVDFFVLGRAENVQPKVLEAVRQGADTVTDPHVVSSANFSMDRLYYLNQVMEPYPYEIALPNGRKYRESSIGCNHKCLFCGYTWQRRHTDSGAFRYGDLWTGNRDVERAMLDLAQGVEVDLVKLRTTAIDGMSERLRRMVNKPITREILRDFLSRLARCEKPHQVKLYNIVGYPTETEADWEEFLEDVAAVDRKLPRSERQTSLLLHSTPFRAMPVTPLACKPMAYVNFRGLISKILGRGRYRGNIFFQGNAMWAVESMGTESLATVIQSAAVWRGTEEDQDSFLRIARSQKFRGASAAVRQATLERYFDVDRLFGAYTPETLPTRNIRTYCQPERMW